MQNEKTMCSSGTHESAMQRSVVRISELRDFHSHPFHVEKNAALYELAQSIRQEGMLVPLIVRPLDGADGYEIISGHRRKLAALWAGLEEVPVLIREMDDEEAVIAMIDSNLQREHIKPSEKAYAYKMRLEAMKHQGKRDWMTSDQVEPKLVGKHIRSNELLAKQIGENVNQIKCYIRLTYLIPQILQMVDDGRLAMTSAVELSFLNEQEQYELYAIMDMEQSVPSLSQANRLKRMSQQGKLDMDRICQVLQEMKPNQKEQIKIPMERIGRYFPTAFTPSQQIALIEELLRGWAKQNNR